MTKNDFILQAMISMAGNNGHFDTGYRTRVSDAHNLAEAAKVLADAAEEVAEFDD